eukprot:9261642-Ditylum_brightwellii.AAC.1
MKESAAGVGTDDEGNEYMYLESVVMCGNGAIYVSFKDAIKLHEKMRSVHECKDMVVVENAVKRSDFFWNEDDWEEEGIFGTGDSDEMNNVDVE